jgi:hypothetical protein
VSFVDGQSVTNRVTRKGTTATPPSTSGLKGWSTNATTYTYFDTSTPITEPITLYAFYNSTDATISAASLAGVSATGSFGGGESIYYSRELNVNIGESQITDAALAFTRGNEYSTINHIKSSTTPTNDDFTGTYDGTDTISTVADGDIIWIRVTAENTYYKSYYKLIVKVQPDPVKTVAVGTQTGTVIEGTGGTVTFDVTTENITNNTYTATVANMPIGVSAGTVAILSNSGTLTLTVPSTVAAGTTATLTLTIDGTTSAAFTLTVLPDTTPTVSTVTVSPSTVGLTVDSSQQFSATVTGNNNPATTVNWTVSGNAGAVDIGTTIIDGLLTVSVSELNTTLTVTATSTYDTSKFGTATVTVGAAAPATYPVTIDGVLYNNYEESATVTITATTPNPGYSFARWTATGVSLLDSTQAEISFTMPANAVVLITDYDALAYYVYVTGGTPSPASGNIDDTIIITATVPSGMEFVSWTVDSYNVTPENAPPPSAPPAPPAQETPVNDENSNNLPVEVERTENGAEFTAPNGVISKVEETPDGSVKVEAGINESGAVNAQATAAAVAEAAAMAQANGESSFVLQIPEGAQGLSKNTIQQIVEAAGETNPQPSQSDLTN